MRTAVDTNVLSAVLALEPSSRPLIAKLGQCRREGPLMICGAVYAELHAIPRMTRPILEEFLEDTGIVVEARTELDDWKIVGSAFNAYAIRRRKTGDGQGKRLLADFIIAGHASRHCDRLFTLDPKRYRQSFPELELIAL